jgi:hypothetical protein
MTMEGGVTTVRRLAGIDLAAGRKAAQEVILGCETRRLRDDPLNGYAEARRFRAEPTIAPYSGGHVVQGNAEDSACEKRPWGCIVPPLTTPTRSFYLMRAPSPGFGESTGCAPRASPRPRRTTLGSVRDAPANGRIIAASSHPEPPPPPPDRSRQKPRKAWLSCSASSSASSASPYQQE